MVKSVTIQLTKEISLPADFDEHGEKILEYGIEVYQQIEKLALLKDQSEKIKRIEEEHTKRVRKLEDEYSALQQRIKEEKRSENESINEWLEKGRSQRDREIEYLKEEIRNKDEKLHILMNSKQNQSIEDLNTKVLGLLQEIQSFNSYVGASSAQKGAVGENIVSQYLASHFPNYNVVDTSKNNASMSDLFMSSLDGKYNILVEVKNVNLLSNVDRQKFVYDIEVSSKNGKINGAILYSLHNANINSRCFNIVYHYGIPTLYISNVKNNIEMIQYGIFVLEELIQKSKMLDGGDEEGNEDLMKMIDMLNKSVNEEFDMLEKDRKQIIFYENQYKERFKRTSSQMSYVKSMIEKYGGEVKVSKKQKVEENGDGEGKGDEELINSLLQKIVDSGLKSEQINQSALTKLGIKNVDITKAGGIKQMKALLKTFVGSGGEPIIIKNDD